MSNTKSRCVPKIEYPTGTLSDALTDMFIDILIGMLVDIWTDMFIDMLIDMFIETFIAMFINMGTFFLPLLGQDIRILVLRARILTRRANFAMSGLDH